MTKRAGRPSPTRSRRAGVSLLEVTIALGILGFGVLGAAAAQVTSVKMNRDSRVRTEAHYLAQQQMELFQAMSGAAVAAIGTGSDADPIDPDPNDGMARAFARSWTMTPVAGETGVFNLIVTVAWVDENGTTRNTSVRSIRTNL